MIPVNITDWVLTLEEMNAGELRGLTVTLVYLSIICVTGIIGNSVVCHVYRTRYSLSNSQCFILCLSAMDLFSCLLVIPFEITTLLDQYTFEYTWLCKLSRFLNTFGTTSAASLLLFIAIDRYRKVCHPFGWQISSTIVKYLCVLAVFLAVLVSWPALFIYGKRTFEIAEYSLIGTECSTNDVMANTTIPFINAAVFGVLFVTEIIVICILYCLIGREVNKHANKMPKDYSIKSSSTVNMNSTLENIDKHCFITSRVSHNTLDKNSHDCKAQNNKRSEFKKGMATHVSEHDISCDNDRTDEQINIKNRNIQFPNKAANDLIHGQSVEREINSDHSGIISEQHEDYIGDKQVVEQTNSEYDDEKVDNFPDSCQPENTHNMNAASYAKQDCDIITLERGQSFPTQTLKKQVKKKHSFINSNMSAVGRRISFAMSRITSITSANSDTNSTVLQKQYLEQARARKMALLMFLISLAFVVSYLPHLVLILFRVLKGDFLENMNGNSRAIYRFFLRSYFLNCAINPVIYGVCDTRFRVAVKELFSKCCKN